MTFKLITWTSITQVMVHLISGIVIVRLLTVCVQVLGLIFDWEKEVIWTSVIHNNCS